MDPSFLRVLKFSLQTTAESRLWYDKFNPGKPGNLIPYEIFIPGLKNYVLNKMISVYISDNLTESQHV